MQPAIDLLVIQPSWAHLLHTIGQEAEEQISCVLHKNICYECSLEWPSQDVFLKKKTKKKH